MLSRFAYLLMMPAFQNEGTIGEYIDSLRPWGDDFLAWIGENDENLCERLCKLSEDGGPEPDEAIFSQPDVLENDGLGISADLLQAWSDFIDSDPAKKEVIGKEIHDWFFWNSEPADIYYWLQEGGIPDLKTAVEWCQEEWPDLDWTNAPREVVHEN